MYYEYAMLSLIISNRIPIGMHSSVETVCTSPARHSRGMQLYLSGSIPDGRTTGAVNHSSTGRCSPTGCKTRANITLRPDTKHLFNYLQ
jgi:hypothetical protein